MTSSMEGYKWADLVPELLVSDLQVSLDFWCKVLGFRVVFDRQESRFAYLEYQGSQIMLDQRNGRWETGPLEYPFGRGINMQIETDELEAMKSRLRARGWPLYEEREKTYRTGDRFLRRREFLVQDPDGYLLRFAMTIDGKGHDVTH